MNIRLTKSEITARQEIYKLVEEYYNNFHGKKEFIPGKSKINFAGRIYDDNEMKNIVGSALDFWLTEGKYVNEFNKKFTEFLGVKYCSLTNSGSSANLLAVSALTSWKLGDKRLKKRDEIITTSACFPTTVAPIIQNGIIPVFIDVCIDTLNAKVKDIEENITDKTKAIFMAHTLGNPFDLGEVKRICEEHKLYLVEDCCDALGSKYRDKYIGTFGDIATFSFYPAHHITMGEGGAVVTDSEELNTIIESYRDWGRDCNCKGGQDNSCGNRFNRNYDHKYCYSHIGYNLKLTEMQAAIGVAQMDKLEGFITTRKRNYKMLYEGLKDLNFVIDMNGDNDNVSWFGFAMTIMPNMNFSRNDITTFLENNNIQTRNLFAGNITEQEMILMNNVDYRIGVNGLKNTRYIMNNTFWIGVYPGITKEMIEYIIKKIREFVIDYAKNYNIR